MWKFVRKIFRKEPLAYLLEEDPEGKGYTVHFEQFPDTFAQGETEEEAVTNLLRTLIAINSIETEEKHKYTSEFYAPQNIKKVELPFQLV